MEVKTLFGTIDAMPNYKRVTLAIEEQILSGPRSGELAIAQRE